MPFDSQSVTYEASLGNITSPRTTRSSIPAPVFSYRYMFKRVFDVTIAAAICVIAAPFLLLMAALVSMDGHSPFYTQLRVGRFGKPFRMLKLRTMVHDADARMEAYLAANPEARAEWDATQKLKNDPRVTLVGRVLRKSSMDELPQLLNVIAGSMSLVGPRPMMLEQQKIYPGTRYFKLRPGLSGFWQVSDRHNSNFRDRAHFDDDYDGKLSLGTDLRVLMDTVRVVLRGTGC